jgi:oxygen-independent coproporphyrinogen-3 oxidase
MLAGGIRYHAELVPHDDAIAAMYSQGIETLAQAGLAQYEISNFSRSGYASRHNLRYWQRRPYLGLGLDASSMLHEASAAARSVLRSTTTSDLRAYLEGAGAVEADWFSPDRQHEEAWFLGLRMNGGVDVSALELEFGNERVSLAMSVVERLQAEGLLQSDGNFVRLTSQGRMLSNTVFQEFLDLAAIRC